MWCPFCVLFQIDCAVCSYCFRFIGSIEFQIGRRLYWQNVGSSSDCTNRRHCHESDVGSSASSSGATKENSSTLPEEVLGSLITGDMSLPFTDHFSLPQVVPCRGCEEERYCRFESLTILQFTLSFGCNTQRC